MMCAMRIGRTRGGGSRHIVAALAVMALATACSDDADAGDSKGPPERLADAVTDLAQANTGHFVSETAASDGTRFSAMAGEYRLSPPQAHVKVASHSPSGAERGTEVVAIGRDVWSRNLHPDPADPGCWLHYDVVELFASGLLVRNGDTYAPAPIAVAGLGLGASATDEDQVSGTSPLSTVLAVADLALPTELGIPRAAEHTVSTTFTVDDGELSGWTVLVRDVLEQARRFDDRATQTGTTLLSALQGFGGSITTELADLGGAVDVLAPPREQVVEYVDDAEELASAIDACSARTH
jgi:hypothetical protein